MANPRRPKGKLAPSGNRNPGSTFKPAKNPHPGLQVSKEAVLRRIRKGKR